MGKMKTDIEENNIDCVITNSIYFNTYQQLKIPNILSYFVFSVLGWISTPQKKVQITY